jgi:predicted alpha/beta-fold hydrolase
VQPVDYQRERIETPDGDFLDLDWVRNGNRKLAVLSHGLEGHSRRKYIQGMIRALLRRGWDAVAWNFRGCSGEPNRLLRFYHSGDTADLKTVLEHIHSRHDYSRIDLIGFSLGGNVTLKFLGELGDQAACYAHAAVAFSVPCDLAAGARRMAEFQNRIYMANFLKRLHGKICAKSRLFPGQIDDTGFRRIRDFKGFDDRYTAPLHGFADAEDYWQRCSSRPFLTAIRIPTLLVNAQNDPFLADGCYPVKQAESNPHLYLETPASGGHLGFVSFPQKEYWSESRAAVFLDSIVANASANDPSPFIRG